MRLVYWEAVPDRAAAQQREEAIKRAGRDAKQRLMASATDAVDDINARPVSSSQAGQRRK